MTDHERKLFEEDKHVVLNQDQWPLHSVLPMKHRTEKKDGLGGFPVLGMMIRGDGPRVYTNQDSATGYTDPMALAYLSSAEIKQHFARLNLPVREYPNVDALLADWYVD